MWEIKGKDNQTKASVYALEYNGEWMGESYVSVTIESPSPIAFAIGDYLMYRGERFEINYDPGKIKSAPQFAKGDAFKYENIKFNSLADELTRCDFLDVVLGDNQLHFTGLPKFSFYGGVQDLANRIQANLNRAYPNQWTVVVSSEYSGTKELNVSVDTQKVWDALSILVNDFETYFTIKGRTITIGAAGVPAGHLFKYGKGNGLYEIEQNAEADQAIVTRLRAYGSTRNLPHRYYNSLTDADGQKLIPDNMAVQYLMLPNFPYTTQDPYIDSANKAALGIREGTVFFDGSQEGLEEIYPSIEGMTAEQLKAAGVPCNSTGALDEIVSAEQMADDGVGDINEGETETTATPPTFKVTVKDLGFDINDHLATETATLSFKTGMLGGREFEIVGCEAIKDNTDKVTGYKLELNRVYDDGIKLWFPYKDYNAKPGDKFVLLHIEMPEVYIKAAAQRLLTAAQAWLAKNDYSRSVYAPKVDEIFMARQHDEAMASGGSIASLHDTLKEGMMLLFEDEDLNIDASIFIDRLTIKEGDGSVPTYEVVLKEEKTVGRLDKMQNQIDSLASGGQGGYSASQIRQIVNAYGGSQFLSKLKDDRSAGKIASDLGFEVGNYLAGVSGGMFGIDKADGKSFAEVAKLFVYGKAYFESLTTIEAQTLAGKQYITPGGAIKCSKVEEVKDTDGNVTAYRCYFLAEQDGEKTDTKIIAGDQAVSEMFNAKTGTSNKISNHRYWRYVNAVNNDAYTDDAGNHYGYIDLSATDCEPDSDIPQAGDVIDQLGNRTDATRQTAIVFSTVDADSPSIKMFGGIGSGETNAEHYSLNGKAIISFGREATTGKVYCRLGSSDATQYLDYTQDGGLKLAGTLSVGSRIGDKTVTQFVEDLIPEEYDDTAIKSEIDEYKYLKEALKQTQVSQITNGLVLSTLIQLGYTDDDNVRHTLAGMNGSYIDTLGGRTIASWYGGPMVDLFNADGTKKTDLAAGQYAASLDRMDGSGYKANGNFRWDNTGVTKFGDTDNGYGITIDPQGRLILGSGIEINIGSGAQGLGSTLSSIANWQNNFENYLVPVIKDENGNDTEVSWAQAAGKTIVALKAKVGFYSEDFISAHGLNDASTPVTPGASALADLSDVLLSATLGTNDTLLYDGSKWVNKANTVGNLSDVTLSAVQNGHALVFENGQWVNKAIAGGAEGAVTALGVSGGYLTWTKDGVTNNLRVPYADSASALFSNGVIGDFNASINKNGIYVWEAETANRGVLPSYGTFLQWSNVFEPIAGTSQHWITQLASATDYNGLWIRTRTNEAAWTPWERILTSYCYPGILDDRYVTKDTVQTITGVKFFDGAVAHSTAMFFQKAGHEGGYYLSPQESGALDISTHVNRTWVATAASFQSDGIFRSFYGMMAPKFKVPGGASTQFLKADGSLDGNGYVNKAGDTMTGNLVIDSAELINVHPDTTGGTARTIRFNDHDGTFCYGFGSLLDNHVRRYAFIGWGAEPWSQPTNLAVGDGVFTYKGNAVLHSGNFESTILEKFGWSSMSRFASWGTQIGTVLSTWNDVTGGSIAFRRDNPVAGEMSAVIDGYWYQNEGQYRCLDTSDITNTLPNTFVKKTGDTMTGALTIQTGADIKLIFNNTDGERYTWISFRENGSEYGALVATADRYEFYSKYLRAPYFVAANTTLCQNLNADLLDGRHGTDFAHMDVVHGQSGDSNLGLLQSAFSRFADSRGRAVRIEHGAHSMAFGWFLEGYPYEQAWGGWFISDYGNPTWVGVNNGSWKSETFAFLSSNVASATRLQGTYSLWGQSFYGNDVNNTIHVKFSGAGNYNEGIRLYGTAKDNAWANIHFGCDPSATVGTHYNQWILGRDNNNNFQLDVNGSSGGIMAWLRNGYVGIGTYSPSYKLTVNGDIYATSGWLRTYGQNGLYFESCGGGWHMTDSSWIRAYNEKGVLINKGRGIGPGQWRVGLKLEAPDHNSIEISAASYTFGIGMHSDSGVYWWKGSQQPYSPDYKTCCMMYKNDVFNFYGAIHSTIGIWSDNYISGHGQNTSSDARLKYILDPVTLDIRKIANAPSVRFRWLKENEEDAGSIAQYWQEHLPWTVRRQPNGYLGLDYGRAALLSAISIAKTVTRHEDRLMALETRCNQLEAENRQLRNELQTLKQYN